MLLCSAAYFSVVAIGARLSLHHEKAQKYMEVATEALKEAFDEPSVEAILALTLMGKSLFSFIHLVVPVYCFLFDWIRFLRMTWNDWTQGKRSIARCLLFFPVILLTTSCLLSRVITIRIFHSL